MNMCVLRTAVLTVAVALICLQSSSTRADTLRHAIRATKVIDLTHTMHENLPFWPGGAPFTKILLVDYDQGYRLHKFDMGESTGTHVDAPSHIFQGQRPIDKIPLGDLIAPAVVINVQDKVATHPDYRLSAQDVRAWEAKHGPIPAGALVILNTGWHKRIGEAKRYLNMDANQVMHFPGYGKESAELLLKRDVVSLGIDTLSLDHGPSNDFPTHVVMLGANKYLIENMANLDALPPTGATVVIGVLPVQDGTQAQARVLAFLP